MAKSEEPITIKKYANRRLYNTATSSYVTLEHLAQMVREGEDFVVYDAKTNEDLTRQILTQIILPLAIPGLISASIFSLTLCWNEFIYALTFVSSNTNKTVPVAIVTSLVDGDIYRWGSLMAGALVGSLPLVILYSFFVEHYVAAMTGAVKE